MRPAHTLAPARLVSPVRLAVVGALAFAFTLSACAAPRAAQPVVHRVEHSPAPPVDPVDPFRSRGRVAPTDDMPESERIEWHQRHASPSQAPRVGQSLAPPVRVVNVVEREIVREPYRASAWLPPIALALGYWWGSDHHRHGYRHRGHARWGIGWHVPLW